MKQASHFSLSILTPQNPIPLPPPSSPSSFTHLKPEPQLHSATRKRSRSEDVEENLTPTPYAASTPSPKPTPYAAIKKRRRQQTTEKYAEGSVPPYKKQRIDLKVSQAEKPSAHRLPPPLAQDGIPATISRSSKFNGAIDSIPSKDPRHHEAAAKIMEPKLKMVIRRDNNNGDDNKSDEDWCNGNAADKVASIMTKNKCPIDQKSSDALEVDYQSAVTGTHRILFAKSGEFVSVKLHTQPCSQKVLASCIHRIQQRQEWKQFWEQYISAKHNLVLLPTDIITFKSLLTRIPPFRSHFVIPSGTFARLGLGNSLSYVSYRDISGNNVCMP